MSRRTPGDEGMILVNVLMFVAIASGIVLLLISREEIALDRAIRSREAARALAIVRGGETSALVALRRDARDAPDADYASEPWGAIADSDVPIEGGRFDLAIADAEGRFNVNAVRKDDLSAQLLFAKIGRAAGFDDNQLAVAVGLIREYGPISDLRPLRYSGVPSELADRLERLATALPGSTTINLNAASPELMTVLFDDPVVAERLVATRTRQGFLSLQDLADEGVTMPPGASLRSNTFWVRTRATVGGTAQQGATLIQRRAGEEGPVVVPVARWRNAAVPPEAPAFVAPRKPAA
ncbi:MULTISPECIES: general secretion pathway protein GspK [Sphingomonas]|uniref:Type II secretion system protein GspK n=1 Tax=Sphingomonas molluscorum TaxID=418184 RepID=A0ABU8Q253_9SPHN|nr:type II secretion system protein GspK [Sphingomonas sp. JUb134]MBM7404482.1 general secretion pathway protein K [Sphingomonas sp. JUb134]